MRQLSVLCLLTLLAACGGGGGGGTPTAPAPTISSIAVTLGDILLVARTANAAATATMSNGQTQAVTSGWSSNATHVATVTDTGTVRGVANGTAVISVSSGGHTASRTIRVAPDYDGRWDGLQTATACRDSGDFTGICREPELQELIGDSFAIGLTARHPGGLDVSGEFQAEGTTFPTFTTSVEDDGTIRFSGVADDEDIRMNVRWVMRSDTAGRASGSMEEVFTFPGLVQGEITFDFTFTASRAGAAAVQGTGRPSSARSSVAERLRTWRRR